MKLRNIVTAGLLGFAALPSANATRDSALNSCLDNPERVLAITQDQRLLCFKKISPENAHTVGFLSGFINDSRLIGIDYRVQDGQLYGVGDTGNVYTIDTKTAAMSFVNALTFTPFGDDFGVDFNPVVDRLRIISDNTQNLRHNPNPVGGTMADGALNDLNGEPASTLTGAAYTNNDLDAATGTTLFNIGWLLDQVTIQAPANSGTQNPTGKLGVDTTGSIGFDIQTRKPASAGGPVVNSAFASLTRASDGRTGFYKVDLLSGQATLVQLFKVGVEVVDIALPTAVNTDGTAK